jgi:SAM-dependent methyltransferase
MDNEKILDQNYWDSRYVSNDIAWDLAEVSSPIKAYIDQLTNKNLRILIPGCGNTYEAEYLLNQGFTNISIIDISPTLVKDLRKKFAENPNINVILGDFFRHEGEYDLVIEQTFFCAINPHLRADYIAQMQKILAEKGKIVGVLFDRIFPFEGPPFGGTLQEYRFHFEPFFEIKVLESCHNSVEKRKGEEVFIHFIKK